jgi:hypothetical protein
MFAQLVFIYGIFVTYDHVEGGWQGLQTIRAIVGDLAPFMAAAAFIPFLIFAEVEIIMILYNIVKEQIAARQKKRVERARAEGLAEGRSEGLAEGRSEGRSEGLAEGFQEANTEWMEWFKRKDAAEAAGEPFNEPSPAEKYEKKNRS